MKALLSRVRLVVGGLICRFERKHDWGRAVFQAETGTWRKACRRCLHGRPVQRRAK